MMTSDNIFDQLTKSGLGSDITTDGPIAENDPEASSLDNGQYTPRKIKDTSQELLKYGLLEMASKPKLYQTAVTHQTSIDQILEPLDLRLEIDDIRGLAFLMVSQSFCKEDQEEWSHPLIRKQRLNLELSLLLAILREFYVAHELEAGIGSTQATVPLEDLIPRLRIFLGDPGSETKEENHLRNLLEKLKSHGVVSEVDNRYDQVIIRPIITHLANPENLNALLATLKKQADSEKNEIRDSLEE